MNSSTKSPAVLVVVSGPPASGKTFVAEELVRLLDMPLIAKDDLKEILFETLGHETQDKNRAFGVAAIEIMQHVARQILRVGQSVILECNFRPLLAHEELGAIQRHTNCNIVQVHVTAPPDVLIERFKQRWLAGTRHPGHHDDETVAQVEASIREGVYGIIHLDAPVICVDTSDFAQVDVGAIASELRTLRSQ